MPNRKGFALKPVLDVSPVMTRGDHKPGSRSTSISVPRIVANKLKECAEQIQYEDIEI